LNIYPDSSFLVSAYLIDRYSPDVMRRMAARPGILVTPFHRAELVNAIFQQVFRGRIKNSDALTACDNFERDCVVGVWILPDLPEKSFITCVELARRYVATLGVRTLDTLHVAAALELGATQFWTFDERQKKLAEAEGLATN
jgi:predicted nucleic acid-binding protein